MRSGFDTRAFGSDEALALIRRCPEAEAYGEPIRSVWRRVNAIVFRWEDGALVFASSKAPADALLDGAR